jgi:hypothetical protein
MIVLFSFYLVRIWELVECVVVLGFVVRTSKAEEAWGAN